MLVLALTLLAACGGGGPEGGVKPALDTVPEQVPARYDAFERSVLMQSLTVAGDEVRAEAATADARLRGEPPPVPGASADAPIVRPAPARAAARPPGSATLREDLFGADDVVGIAQAVLRDRALLAQRAALLDAFENPPAVPPERVTVVAFAPEATTIGGFERRRLEAAVRATAAAPEWLVRAGGPSGDARAAAVAAVLVALDVPRTAITLEIGDRDVDVAEVAVRR